MFPRISSTFILLAGLGYVIAKPQDSNSDVAEDTQAAKATTQVVTVGESLLVTAIAANGEDIPIIKASNTKAIVSATSREDGPVPTFVIQMTAAGE